MREDQRGACTDAGRRLQAGDRIELTYHAGQRYHPLNKPRQNLGFEIVFEDKHVIVVNKPAQLLTVPTKKGETNTLLDKVSEYARHVSHIRQASTPHRLDRGVVRFARLRQEPGDFAGDSRSVRPAQAGAGIRSDPRRAFVKKEEGTIRSLLATDRDLNRFSTDDEEIGQLAITHFKIAERLHETTLVSIWLETGRRNQIRVHFAEEGHPGLGDPRYLPEVAEHRHWPETRTASSRSAAGI